MTENFSDLKYVRPDFDKISRVCRDLHKQLKKFTLKAEKIKLLFEQFSEEYLNFVSMYNLCSILRYIKNDNDNSIDFFAEYELFSEKISELQTCYNQVFAMIADLDIQFADDALSRSSIINEARRIALTEAKVDKDLLDREHQLIDANRNFIKNIAINVETYEPGNFSYSDPQDPKSFDIYIEEINNWFRLADAETRIQIYHNFSQKLLGFAEERNHDFRELVIIRKKQAEQSNLTCFDFVTSKNKGYGYTRRQLILFKKYLQEYFLPLIEEITSLRNQRLHKEINFYYDHLKLLPESRFNLINKDVSVKNVFGETIRQIIGDEGSYVDNLIRGKFWTSEPRLRRELERDVTLLPKWNSVYLSLSFSRPAFILEDDFYSIGKALADLSAMINFKGIACYVQSDLVRKISGLAMVFLSSRKTELFAGENAELFNDLSLCYEILKIPKAMAIDTFEATVYSAESDNDLNYANLWKQIEQNLNINYDYGSDGYFSEGNSWQLVQRIFDKPFSALNRVLALIVILAERPHRDKRNRLETKLNKLLTSNTDLPFVKRLLISGFSSPFELDTIRRASFTVCDILRL
ncbi:MAG TPA: hypothetical protein GXZ43_05115 [Clostridiaceae bacterium]|nr:hypothetical protein [Clostridiaceae bacterium]